MNYSFEPHIVNDPRFPFAFVRMYNDIADAELDCNWHRNSEILYFLNGEGVVHCDTNKYAVHAGDVFVVNANSMHGVGSKSGVEYYCLIIDPDFCSENGIDTDGLLFQNLIRDDTLNGILDGLIDEYENKRDYYFAGIRGGVLSLLVYIARNYRADTVALSKRPGGKVAENMRIAVGYIKSHFTESLTIEDISNEVGLSRYHFVREFKKVVGVTPIAYINVLRCSKARRMLSSGDYKIAEVQEECGFENASYFTKVFKKLCGVTPRQYAISRKEE